MQKFIGHQDDFYSNKYSYLSRQNPVKIQIKKRIYIFCICKQLLVWYLHIPQCKTVDENSYVKETYWDQGKPMYLWPLSQDLKERLNIDRNGTWVYFMLCIVFDIVFPYYKHDDRFNFAITMSYNEYKYMCCRAMHGALDIFGSAALLYLVFFTWTFIVFICLFVFLWCIMYIILFPFDTRWQILHVSNSCNLQQIEGLSFYISCPAYTSFITSKCKGNLYYLITINNLDITTQCSFLDAVCTM